MLRAAVAFLLCTVAVLGQLQFVHNAEDATAAEDTLQRNPDDLDLRLRLVGYYFQLVLQKKADATTENRRNAHVLWLVEHRPDAAILGMREGPLRDVRQAPLSAVWRKQAARDDL